MNLEAQYGNLFVSEMTADALIRIVKHPIATQVGKEQNHEDRTGIHVRAGL